MPGDHLAAAASTLPWPKTGGDAARIAGLLVCLCVGTACLPHTLTRFLTAPSAQQARRTAGWGFVFVALIVTAIPAYVLMTKLEMVRTLPGLPLDALPAWVHRLSVEGLVIICGVPAVLTEAIRTACAEIDSYYSALRLQDFALNPRAVVPAFSEILGLGGTFSDFLAIGVLAALFSAGNGLLLTIANSLAHNGFHRTLSPRATAARRLFVTRLVPLPVAELAAHVALAGVLVLPGLVTSALVLAAAVFFPALVLGIWWKRATAAAAGMAAEIAVACALQMGVDMGFGAGILSAAPFGIAAEFMVAIVVSLVTAAPGSEATQFVNAIRRPTVDPALSDNAM